jgi:hypothetical protein
MGNTKHRYLNSELEKIAADGDSQWIYRMAAELILEVRDINEKLDEILLTQHTMSQVSNLCDQIDEHDKQWKLETARADRAELERDELLKRVCGT